MQHVDLGFVGVLRGEARRRALEDFPHRVELEHLLLAQFGDDQAAAGADDQHAALLQPPQCLAHRRPAHPERARDLLLGNTLAGANRPSQIASRSAGEHEFAARRVAQRIRRGRRQLARFQRHDLARELRCHRRRARARSRCTRFTTVYRCIQSVTGSAALGAIASSTFEQEISMARTGAERASKPAHAISRAARLARAGRQAGRAAQGRRRPLGRRDGRDHPHAHGEEPRHRAGDPVRRRARLSARASARSTASSRRCAASL